MKRWMPMVLAGALLAAAPLGADEALPAPKEDPVPKENPVHDELRALRDGIMDAFNKNDMDRLLTHVHKNAVVTWQNGDVSRGHDGIREYHKRMLTGDNHIVQSVKAEAKVDELTILYGDKNGLAFGTLDEDFKLTDGREFHLANRWTADVVKEDDRWKVAGLHVSANVFDNPILEIAVKKTAWWVGGGALVVGLLLGLVIGRMLGKRRVA